MNQTETIIYNNATNTDVVRMAMDSISCDPIYSEHFVMKFIFFLRMIQKGGLRNSRIPDYMYTRVVGALKKQRKSFKGSRVLFLGVAYKPDSDEMRESLALEIMDWFAKKGGLVSYHDPYIPTVETHSGASHFSVSLTPETLRAADCVVITTHHKVLDVEFIREHARMIVDTHKVLKEAIVKETKL